MEDITKILLFILPLLGGLFGYFLKYYLDKRKELESNVLIKKREIYTRFVEAIIKAMDSSEDPRKKEEAAKEFGKLYSEVLIYSSSKFITDFGNLMQYLFAKDANPSQTFSLLGITIQTMRKELGLDNKYLGTFGEKLFKPKIKDYYKYFSD